MRRGTTPTLNFKVPVDTELLEIVNISFSQKNKIILEKELKDCKVVDSDTVSLQLSEEETLLMSAKCKLSMQLRAKLQDGSVIASNIVSETVEPILKDGVLHG